MSQAAGGYLSTAVAIEESTVDLGRQTDQPDEDATMTTHMRNLRALLAKNSDANLLREMIAFAAQRLMELEVEGLTGAAPSAAAHSKNARSLQATFCS